MGQDSSRDRGDVTRRSVLGVGFAAAAGLGVSGALAACTNSGSDGPGRSGSGSGSDSSSRNDSKASRGSGTLVTPLSAVPVGGVEAVTIDSKPAFVARPTEDSVIAFSAICTHQRCTVRDGGEVLICPCHGSHFAPLSGDVLRGPATRPLPLIGVHINRGNVEIA